jgi:predicted DNA-binding ribbon-helix-helix protein
MSLTGLIEAFDAEAARVHPQEPVMTADQVKAVLDAVRREVTESHVWDEIKDMSLADLCAANQDALIDDLYEDHPDDRPRRPAMVSHVATYDTLLGTGRLAEVPAETGDN